jgi:alpha-galactosidase
MQTCFPAAHSVFCTILLKFGGIGSNANWPPQQQFAQAAKFAHLIGLNGTYLNLDDLPAGHMTLMGCNPQTLGPCVWSESQQKSVFSLYAMTRSPIMFSGDMPTDDATLKIVTNREVLAIQDHSVNNKQLSNVAKCSSYSNDSYACSEVIWVADCSDDPTNHGKYVAFFWTGSGNTTIKLPVVQLGGSFTTGKPVIVRDLWRNEDLPRVTDGSLVANLGPHDVLLLRVSPG